MLITAPSFAGICCMPLLQLVVCTRGVPQHDLRRLLQWYVDQAVGMQQPLELFYSDARCRQAYKQYVAMLIGRANTINGIPYASDGAGAGLCKYWSVVEGVLCMSATHYRMGAKCSHGSWPTNHRRACSTNAMPACWCGTELPPRYALWVVLSNAGCVLCRQNKLVKSVTAVTMYFGS